MSHREGRSCSFSGDKEDFRHYVKDDRVLLLYIVEWQKLAYIITEMQSIFYIEKYLVKSLPTLTMRAQLMGDSKRVLTGQHMIMANF